jgi:hypothetical protein
MIRAVVLAVSAEQLKPQSTGGLNAWTALMGNFRIGTGVLRIKGNGSVKAVGVSYTTYRITKPVN